MRKQQVVPEVINVNLAKMAYKVNGWGEEVLPKSQEYATLRLLFPSSWGIQVVTQGGHFMASSSNG